VLAIGVTILICSAARYFIEGSIAQEEAMIQVAARRLGIIARPRPLPRRASLHPNGDLSGHDIMRQSGNSPHKVSGAGNRNVWLPLLLHR
jgi:hypothetical protein